MFHINPDVKTILLAIITFLALEVTRAIISRLKRGTRDEHEDRVLKQYEKLLKAVEDEREDCRGEREKNRDEIERNETRIQSLEEEVGKLKKASAKYESELHMANEAARLALIGQQVNELALKESQDKVRNLELLLAESTVQLTASREEAKRLRKALAVFENPPKAT